MMHLGLFLACGLLVAAPAFAHKEDDTPAAAKDPNKVVCKTEDVIGSRLQTDKKCMTVAQWDQMRRDNMAMMERAQSGGGQQGH